MANVSWKTAEYIEALIKCGASMRDIEIEVGVCRSTIRKIKQKRFPGESDSNIPMSKWREWDEVCSKFRRKEKNNMLELEGGRPAVIAVDFDGTLCEDRYPEIGEPREKIIDYVKFQKAAGASIILWTCRADWYLDEAVKWCAAQGLYFDAINQNLPSHIALYNNDTRKVFADVYIDDKNMILQQIIESV